MNVIELAVEVAGCGTYRRDDVVYITDPDVRLPDGSTPGSVLYQHGWTNLRNWMCRLAQPVNTIMPFIDVLNDERIVHGYDVAGQRKSNGLMALPEDVVVRDADPFVRRWSEVELLIERVKTLDRLLIAIEHGFPAPAWVLKNRWGEYEAGWFVFRPHSLITYYDSNNARSTKGPHAKSEPDRELKLSDGLSSWRQSVRDIVGGEKWESLGRRARLPETFEYPLWSGAELLMLHLGHPTRSRHYFESRVENLREATSGGEPLRGVVHARLEMQRRRGGKPKGASSRGNLDQANIARRAQSDDRMKKVRELLREDPSRTQVQLARALGCDTRTIRNYLAGLSNRPDGAGKGLVRGE